MTADRADVPDLVPARMLNEYAYCPRLSYLMWAQREWADNVETLEGKFGHRRVDQPEGQRARLHSRSIELASPSLGVIAVIDLLERDGGGGVRPVDYKRGKRPAIADGAWEPEKVQLCVQGLLLREHGYETNEGLLYYVASKEKVRIRFTPELIARTKELLVAMRAALATGTMPPPLEDSPKCPRCSLVGICMPEETRFILRGGGNVRPLAVADAAAFPLVVQDPRSRVRLDGERYLVTAPDGATLSARPGETSQLVLMGGASCTEPVLVDCCRRGIPILHMSGTGWLHGLTISMEHKNVELRSEQFAAARDSERSLAVARALVAAKVRNARVLVRRNGKPPETTVGILESFAERAQVAVDDEALLGIEGSASRLYFECFSTMLKVGGEGALAFDFEKRTRRPPADPINAMLSFTYALLLKDWVTVLLGVGFDPYMGLYHRPRYGKPALALDMMEPFRPVVADSVVVGAINNGEVAPTDFVHRPGSVLLSPAGRRSLIEAYERRLAQQIAHPVFGYRCTYRRIFELEARLLGRHLLGELPVYSGFQVR